MIFGCILDLKAQVLPQKCSNHFKDITPPNHAPYNTTNLTVFGKTVKIDIFSISDQVNKSDQIRTLCLIGSDFKI